MFLHITHIYINGFLSLAMCSLLLLLLGHAVGLFFLFLGGFYVLIMALSLKFREYCAQVPRHWQCGAAGAPPSVE